VITLRCLFRGHQWGPVEGTDRGAVHTCTYRGKTKHVGPEPPAETHDGANVHL
jgi:hypothetical protein